MIEYGVPILFLAIVCVVVPVGCAVAAFLTVRGIVRWWLRSVIRFGVVERARAEAGLNRHLSVRPR